MTSVSTNRKITLVVLGLVLALAACGGSSTKASPKFKSTATTQPTAITQPATTTTAPQPATHYLGGNSTASYPSGTGVHVVAQAPLPIPIPVQAAQVAFAIRNDSGHAIGEMKATGEVRDPTGKLVATGNDQGFHPGYVTNGGIAYAYIWLAPGTSVPAGSTLAITVTSKEASTPNT
jgi:hypothetical protein